MNDLKNMQCVPCRGGEPKLSQAEIDERLPQISEWKVIQRDGEDRLERSFKFKDFAGALRFTNQIGEIAEAQDHHPAILTEWGRVTVTWWTHVIHGLHQNDFIMAAKTDELYSVKSP